MPKISDFDNLQAVWKERLIAVNQKERDVQQARTDLQTKLGQLRSARQQEEAAKKDLEDLRDTVYGRGRG